MTLLPFLTKLFLASILLACTLAREDALPTPESIDIEFPLYKVKDEFPVKGQYKEAYCFMMVTRPDHPKTYQEYEMNFEALKLSIYRIRHFEVAENKTGHDFIVIAGSYTPLEQLRELEGLGVVVVRVETINVPNPSNMKWYIDQFTKFHIWKLVNWDRVLYLDIDIFVQEGFMQIWDEPACQIKGRPSFGRELINYPKDKYDDLYPYLFAAVVDLAYRASNGGYFNAGMFMCKPNLVLFKYLIALIDYPGFNRNFMEQDLLNGVFFDNGPLPFQRLDYLYNIFAHNTGEQANVRAYHSKLWIAHRDYFTPTPRLRELWWNLYWAFKNDTEYEKQYHAIDYKPTSPVVLNPNGPILSDPLPDSKRPENTTTIQPVDPTSQPIGPKPEPISKADTPSQPTEINSEKEKPTGTTAQPSDTSNPSDTPTKTDVPSQPVDTPTQPKDKIPELPSTPEIPIQAVDPAANPPRKDDPSIQPPSTDGPVPNGQPPDSKRPKGGKSPKDKPKQYKDDNKGSKDHGRGNNDRDPRRDDPDSRDNQDHKSRYDQPNDSGQDDGFGPGPESRDEPDDRGPVRGNSGDVRPKGYFPLGLLLIVGTGFVLGVCLYRNSGALGNIYNKMFGDSAVKVTDEDDDPHDYENPNKNRRRNSVDKIEMSTSAREHESSF